MRSAADSHNVLWTDRAFRESAALRQLSATALRVLMDFYAKKQMSKKGREYEFTNNGHLIYTYAEARQRGIPGGSFQRAIGQLIEVGFLDIAQTGAGLCRSTTHYALSARWRHYGTPAFRTATRPRRRSKPGFQQGHPRYDPAA